MSTLFVSRLPDGKYVGVTSEDVIQREFEDGALGDLQEGEEIPDKLLEGEKRTPEEVEGNEKLEEGTAEGSETKEVSLEGEERTNNSVEPVVESGEDTAQKELTGLKAALSQERDKSKDLFARLERLEVVQNDQLAKDVKVENPFEFLSTLDDDVDEVSPGLLKKTAETTRNLIQSQNISTGIMISNLMSQVRHANDDVSFDTAKTAAQSALNALPLEVKEQIAQKMLETGDPGEAMYDLGVRYLEESESKDEGSTEKEAGSSDGEKEVEKVTEERQAEQIKQAGKPHPAFSKVTGSENIEGVKADITIEDLQGMTGPEQQQLFNDLALNDRKELDRLMNMLDGNEE